MKNEFIKFAPLFAGLSDGERELLAAGFAEGKCAGQTVLLQAGERSEAMFLIGQGFAGLTTQSGATLATLGPGSLIGDASLFRGQPQDVTATALSELQYWKLTDRGLRDLIVQNPALGLKLSRNFGSLLVQMQDYLVKRLGNVPELAGLPPHTLQALAAHLKPRELHPQDVVYRSGDGPAGLFLVESGQVELRSDVEPVAERIQKLEPGALFGALNLLTGKPAVQSAVAAQDTILWAISADEFAAVSSRQPGLRRTLARNTRARLSKADQSQAVLRLAQMPLFADIPPQIMQAIAQRMVLQHVPAGERVYTMGETGDALYLIENGEVELTSENAGGVVEELARIGNGGYFGEVGLLSGQIRGEDATATRNTNLWILPKAELDTLATQHQAIGQALNKALAAAIATPESQYDEDRFRRFYLLADLSPQDLRQVTEHLHPTRYRAGEQIYRASSTADMLYLLEKGHVRIQPLTGGSWVLGPGEAFGERALLTNQPHNAGAQAETDIDVWTLSKTDFELLMNRYPSLAIGMSRVLSQRLADFSSGGFDDEETMTGGYAATPAVATNVPSRRRRPSAVENPLPESRPRGGFGQWFGNLSALSKVQLAVLILLLIWLLAIAAPAAFLALLRGTSVASGVELTTRTNLLNAINAVYAVGSYELAAKDKELAEALAMADKAVPPTPTHTPLPTQTAIPTSTPLPTHTPTPLPTATNTPPPPVFVQQALPQAPPTPEPEVAVAAVAPRAWDSRLTALGVQVEEANAAPGQQYWRLIEARWADEQQSGGKHHIYVEVLDENGNRIVGQPVTVFWGDGSHTGGVEDKAAPDFGYNYMMYAAGNAYNVKVEGLPSEIVRGAGMGSIEQPKYGIHTSFYLVYQRATK